MAATPREPTLTPLGTRGTLGTVYPIKYPSREATSLSFACVCKGNIYGGSVPSVPAVPMTTTTYTACPCGNPDHWSADNPFGPELVRHRLAIDDHDVDGETLPKPTTPSISPSRSRVVPYG